MGTLFPAEASWLEIEADALAHNASVFREVLGAVRLGGVLKGNAYGHGFPEVLPLAHAACDVLYVI
jgi:alanine racemase